MYMRRWFKKFLVPCYGENGNSSFCLLLWKHLLIFKILSETLFKMLIAEFNSGGRLLFCKLFRKPEMMVKNSKKC
jgi:hypothetical protein